MTDRINDLPSELTNELIQFAANMTVLAVTAAKQICLFVLGILDAVVGYLNNVYGP